MIVTLAALNAGGVAIALAAFLAGLFVIGAGVVSASGRGGPAARRNGDPLDRLATELDAGNERPSPEISRSRRFGSSRTGKDRTR